MATMLAARRLPSLARVAARPQIAALGTTSTCKERQLAWQLYARLVDKHGEREEDLDALLEEACAEEEEEGEEDNLT